MTTDKPTTDETGCKNCDAGVPVQLGQHFLKPPGHSMYSETCTATKPTTEEAGLREVLVQTLVNALSGYELIGGLETPQRSFAREPFWKTPPFAVFPSGMTFEAG